jgi:hypothetical protein
MKRIIALPLTFSMCSILTGLSQGQQPPLTHRLGPHHPQAANLNSRPQLSQGQSLRLPASATADAVQVTCPPEAVGAVCGYVAAPLDRRHSDQEKIKIYFDCTRIPVPDSPKARFLPPLADPDTLRLRPAASFRFSSPPTSTCMICS